MPDRGHVHDVLIIGAGPAGSSCAYWLAESGWDVAVVEKKRFPREKTCGDGLTPRAVRQIADMGLEDALAGAHRFRGLRAYGFGHSVDLNWPDHPHFPNYGYTITRHDLDGLVADRAVKAGATLHQATEARAPVLADGDRTGSSGSGSSGSGSSAPPAPPGTGHGIPACRGVTVVDRASGSEREIRARYIVVADGSNSRIGRALGTGRNRDLPMGMALRGYYRSPRHDDPYIESHLDIRDHEGMVVPGYGWIFPMGDGRVNVGVGLLSTENRWKGVNTTRLMETFVEWVPKSWGLSPETSCGPPTGGKLPMGLSVGPRTGANVVLAGDALGGINPFNGEGISYGYETGRLAAVAVGTALAGGGPAALTGYDRALEAAYGDYFKVANSFVNLISNPATMRLCVSVGMRSRVVMGELLRIMANLMRGPDGGAAEAAYHALLVAARHIPD